MPGRGDQDLRLPPLLTFLALGVRNGGMKLLDMDYYRRLREDHGVRTSFTLAVHPFWWMFGWSCLGGFMGAIGIPLLARLIAAR